MEDFKLFKLHRYVNPDGTFDYDAYRRVQEETSKAKMRTTWAREQDIIAISEYIKSLIPSPKFGLCHGTKRGTEQQWFSEQLGCKVLGTEISDSAKWFDNTIRWDFHEAKAEWLDSTDFVYSNAFDHSYNPEKCLNVWISCLVKGGLCILEHHSWGHSPDVVKESDPFGAYLFIMPYLITVWGDGRYGVRKILELGKRKKGVSYAIVIQRF